jgi:hypothetical protein
MRRQLHQLLPGQLRAGTSLRRDHAAQRLEQAGLARSVGPQHDDQLAGLHQEADLVQRLMLAVAHRDIAHFKHGWPPLTGLHLHSLLPPDSTHQLGS